MDPNLTGSSLSTVCSSPRSRQFTYTASVAYSNQKSSSSIFLRTYNFIVCACSFPARASPSPRSLLPPPPKSARPAAWCLLHKCLSKGFVLIPTAVLSVLSCPQALSVYGYSLTPFLAAAPLCLFSWPVRSCGLATASLVAAIFVLRSAWPRLQEHMPEKSMVLILATVAVYHILWFLLLTVV